MKVLVTGAGGLLGSRMLDVFPAHWEVTGADMSQAPPLVECRLESRDSVARAVRSARYDWVVHCAAIRSPDQCARDPAKAMEINARATGWLARYAADAGARMAYASSHHVFAGDDPPYRETDSPAPLNIYGHTKLAGERHALSVPGGLVVRMSALYSLDLGAPNNFLAGVKRSLDAGRTVRADARHLRYYTLAEEMAAAFAFLMERGCRGVVHVSAAQGCTQLEFYRRAAEAMGLDSSLAVEEEQGAHAVSRPLDSRLDTGLYTSLGGPPLTNCPEALALLRRAVAEPQPQPD